MVSLRVLYENPEVWNMSHKLQTVFLLILCLTVCVPSINSSEGGNGSLLSGSDQSPVKIEVFSDFECPACRELFLQTIRPVMQEYKDKVGIIYYEFPLNMHPYSRPASRYVLAAARLGNQKALSVMSSIYTDQAQWDYANNREAPASRSLDRLEMAVSKALSHEDFLEVKKMLQDPGTLSDINDNIEKELKLGELREIRSTPTMFIFYSGKQQKIEGMVTLPVMKQFLSKLVK